MKSNRNEIQNASPFHSGEQKLQAQYGKREKMEAFGARVIRSFMPDEHRALFEQLPFLVVGSVDEQGWPWASLVDGPEGFISSPDATNLRVDIGQKPEDPVFAALDEGQSVGVLGIELSTRRRNRMNGRIAQLDAAGFTIHVDQSFGNCPQYIAQRQLLLPAEESRAPEPRQAVAFDSLPDDARVLISHADTFFVSSFVQTADRPEIEGVDVSHRGGRPGFVLVEGDTLVVPDFRGNFHFNTLGNFLVNPKAGLVFPDFATGGLLQLTGRVELLSADAPELTDFQGAERGWRFILESGQWLTNALSVGFSSPEPSPRNQMTDDWVSVRQRHTSTNR